MRYLREFQISFSEPSLNHIYIKKKCLKNINKWSPWDFSIGVFTCEERAINYLKKKKGE